MAEVRCPEEIGYEGGCKVSWRPYATREDAEVASGFAMRAAHERAALGYDFGYQSPGAITDNEDGTFTVVWP